MCICWLLLFFKLLYNNIWRCSSPHPPATPHFHSVLLNYCYYIFSMKGDIVICKFSVTRHRQKTPVKFDNSVSDPETELQCVHIVFMCDRLYSDYCRNIQEEIKKTMFMVVPRCQNSSNASSNVICLAVWLVGVCGSAIPSFTTFID